MFLISSNPLPTSHRAEREFRPSRRDEWRRDAVPTQSQTPIVARVTRRLSVRAPTETVTPYRSSVRVERVRVRSRVDVRETRARRSSDDANPLEFSAALGAPWTRITPIRTRRRP